MNDYKKRSNGFSTKAIHVPYEPDRSRTAVVPPITTTSIFRQDEPESIVNFFYGRCGNPTREHLEHGLVSLEGAKYGLAFSSGLAAVSGVAAILKSGDHLICSSNIYSGSIEVFGELRNIQVECDAINFDDLENVRRAMRPNTRVVWFESPTNPLLNVVDIEKCCQIVHSQPNVIAVVDNTL